MRIMTGIKRLALVSGMILIIAGQTLVGAAPTAGAQTEQAVA
jgi:hypothetical protein